MAGADVAGVTSQINLVHALLLHLRGSFCTVRFRFVYRGSLVPRGASMQTVTRPEAAQAYNTVAGAVVLVVGACGSAIAYRLMVRLGRLPDDPRVLR